MPSAGYFSTFRPLVRPYRALWVSFLIQFIFGWVLMETDCALLNAARSMDRDALVKIFDLYSPALYRYALRLCNDPVMADHVVGDVFAKLLDQLASGNGPQDNLRAYLYQTTYHRTIDEARYAHRRVSLEAANWLHQDGNIVVQSSEDQMLFEQILYALRHVLTEDQQHVIILRFLEGFSVVETSRILGKRADHVRVIQNRAITALRKFFKYQEVQKVVRPSMLRTVPEIAPSFGVSL